MAGLPEDLLRRIVDRVRVLEPATVAALLRGSYATGAADRDSDLDLTAITDEAPRAPYRTWFEEHDGRPLPISVSVKRTEEWLAKRESPAEWALGFPAVDVARYVWATDEARAALGADPSPRRPPEPASVEDLVSCAVKVRRAARRRDEVAVRLHARAAALLAPALLVPLNDERVVTDAYEAVAATLELRVAPERFSDDFRAAAGLEARSTEDVADAAARLVSNLLAFVRDRAPAVDPTPDAARYLADGTFERYLAGPG